MQAVHEAAERNDVEALKVLLDADPRLVDAEEDEGGWGPLHVACSAGSLDAARLLLYRGANVNRANGHGFTALMDACNGGYVEVVRLLLAQGSDPTLHDSHRWTAFMFASVGRACSGSDHVAVIRLLLEDGRLPVDASDEGGRPALYLACAEGYPERARVLLMEGMTDHTIANHRGLTPMAFAQRRGQQECVQLLEVRGQFQPLPDLALDWYPHVLT